VEILKELWYLLAAGVAMIVFIVRMEGKTSMHGLEIERLQRQRDADQALAQETRKDDQAAAQRSRDETHRMLHDMDQKLDRLIERNMK